MKTKAREIVSYPYLYLIVVLCLTSIAFQYWSDGIRLLSIALGFLLPFAVCSSYFSTKQFGWLSLYFIVVLLNKITGDAYFSETYGLVMNAAGLFVSSSLTYYIIKSRDERLLQYVLLIVFFILIWTALATVYFDLQIPGIVRRAVNMRREGDVAELRFFYRLGMSDYASPHAIPILIPPLLYGIKRAKSFIHKILYMILLLICFALVYFSGASGPMVITLLLLLLSVVVRKGGIKSNVPLFTALLFLLPFVISDSILLWVLDWLDTIVGGDGYFHYKIVDFQDSLIYGESTGDLEARSDLYEATLSNFFESPIFGSQNIAGGHSAILDRIAALGIVGFIPFIGLLWFEGRKGQHIVPPNAQIYFILSWIAGIAMLLTKNHCGWHMWFYLFTVMPIMLHYIETRSISKLSYNNRKY